MWCRRGADMTCHVTRLRKPSRASHIVAFAAVGRSQHYTPLGPTLPSLVTAKGSTVRTAIFCMCTRSRATDGLGVQHRVAADDMYMYMLSAPAAGCAQISAVG